MLLHTNDCIILQTATNVLASDFKSVIIHTVGMLKETDEFIPDKKILCD